MRNTIISLYQPTHISSLVPTMQSHIDSLFLNVAEAEEGTDIPFYELSLKMAIDVIGDTAFGVQFGLLSKPIPQPTPDDDKPEGGEDQEVSCFLKQHMHSIESLKMDLSSSFSTILGLVVPVLQKPCREVLKRIPGTADYKMYHTNEKLCERIDAIIAKRSSERAYRDSKDFLAAVLNARDSGVAKDLFTQSYIRALTYEHLLAGTKTSAFTLAMTVYLVSKHPEVENKLLQEVDSFGSGGRTPTAEDLQCGFPYLDQASGKRNHEVLHCIPVSCKRDI
ncbi:cytochrome P450 711A1-like isoform X1 [Iris pallida]|uniref:Cytochrome P450 711A1-like isoform X1 n=1 Tax=Iris pallida TaxID=29817 RepID=A0AAX6HNE3_IRIPA|nr:cytochrome P450 711A1-like isoform X1 [Iris pallida]